MGSLSVLNTDLFDRRRFKEIFEMSERLQQLESEAELPMFEALLADIWASLYKMKPEIKTEDVEVVLKVNQILMQAISEHEHFEVYRLFTRLDDLAAAIGTIKFGEMINRWLAVQNNADKDFEHLMKEMMSLHGHLQRQGQQDESESQQAMARISQVMDELQRKIERTIQENSENFFEAIFQAMQESKQIKTHVKALVGGLSTGNEDADLKKVPLRDQIALAEKIAADKQMKEIAEWAGRFKQIARKKQKSIHTESVEKRGITLGNELESLLPMELSLFTHEITKKDFLRRLIEGQTMQYEQKGQEALAKGPIVLCLDQSASMSGLDAQSKGFCLALMSIARKQRRDFCLLVFSTRTQIKIYEKGKMKTSEMIRVARTFLGGGTNFTLALEGALNVIEESRFKQADVILVTDGEDQVSASFLETFNEKKQKKAFNVLSLIIGSNSNTVETFSDRVVQITDLDDKGSFTAFEV